MQGAGEPRADKFGACLVNSRSPVRFRVPAPMGGYYELYPHEIDARLEREAQWTPERVARKLPFARPGNG